MAWNGRRWKEEEEVQSEILSSTLICVLPDSKQIQFQM